MMRRDYSFQPATLGRLQQPYPLFLSTGPRAMRLAEAAREGLVGVRGEGDDAHNARGGKSSGHPTGQPSADH
jgi:hypothetical protein